MIWTDSIKVLVFYAQWHNTFMDLGRLMRTVKKWLSTELAETLRRMKVMVIQWMSRIMDLESLEDCQQN